MVVDQNGDLLSGCPSDGIGQLESSFPTRGLVGSGADIARPSPVDEGWASWRGGRIQDHLDLADFGAQRTHKKD
jgi:hypothetical protein